MVDHDLFELVITSVVTLAASSGVWTYLLRRVSARSATSKLLLSLAYDKIVQRGMEYIDRGWVTRDEFEDFLNNLYEPYKQCGGNGVGSRIMESVSALPLKSHDQYSEISQGGGR